MSLEGKSWPDSGTRRQIVPRQADHMKLFYRKEIQAFILKLLFLRLL